MVNILKLPSELLVLIFEQACPASQAVAFDLTVE
jgi:hypothetical protein